MDQIMTDHLEDVPCPLCGANETLGRPYNLSAFAAVRCSNCELWYLSPRLKEEEMIKLYAQDTYFRSGDNSGYTSYETQKESLKLTFRSFLKQLHNKGLSGGRLLEVGCGYGYLLEEAEKYFHYRVGTDYSAEAVKQASKCCDRAIVGGVNDLSEEENFDMIITVGVIEHIYSPNQFNQTLRARLVEGGKLIHATPDMGSFWRYLMGKRWSSFKVPEHVAYFDCRTLNHLFVEGKFHNLQRLNFPHAFPVSLILEKRHAEQSRPYVVKQPFCK